MTKKNRARIHGLVLINWNGFFFQHFEIDGGVTALEGENGAGKTTVMIAAFVALLPDQRLLQFRNVSEAGVVEGDRGIFGRLGTQGVSYSVVEVLADQGSRILAGVMLCKKTPPNIEITPFIIEGLARNLPLHDILLVQEGETAHVAELAELRQIVGRLAGKLTVCESIGHYTSQLFDLGVTPMRMEAYAERDKFNRMLQTSMYGGLSSSIQKGLRDYLLAEDLSLRNHVVRMRENLEACRVTRQEIESADNKYKIIQGVFQSGYGMFEAAFHGTRLRVVALRRKADFSREDYFRCQKELTTADRQWRDLQHRYAVVNSDLEERRMNFTQVDELWRNRQRAYQLSLELDRHELMRIKAEKERSRSEEQLLVWKKRLGECEAKRDRILLEKEQNALGLADAQKAWEQVARKVTLYRQAAEALEDACNAFPDHEVTDSSAEILLVECRDQWNRAMESKTEIERELESLETRQRRYNEVLEALRRASRKEIDPAQALYAARDLDSEIREMEKRIADAENLQPRIAEAKKLAERQQQVRRKVSLLEGKGAKVQCAAELRFLFESGHNETEDLAQERNDLRDRNTALGQERAQGEQQLEWFCSEAAEWRKAHLLVQKLEDAFTVSIQDGLALESLKKQLEADLKNVEDRLRRMTEERDTARQKAIELEFRGGHLDESLIYLRDLVDGNLVAELYDETSEEDAPMVEARLGPLHKAIIVEDIPDAVEKIVREQNRTDEVWLVEAGTLKDLPPGNSYPAAELVKMGETYRLTRHPGRPAVGRAARLREINRLKANAETLWDEIEKARGEEETFREAIKTIELLSRYWRFLGLPDPAESANRIENRLKEIKEEEAHIRRRMEAIDLRLQHWREVLREITPCLPDADLLDATDWLETLQILQRQHKEADMLRQFLETLRPDILCVRTGWLDLENPPPNQEDIKNRRDALARAEAVLAYWAKGRELLGTLVDRLPHFSYRNQEDLLIEQKSALKNLEEQIGKLDLAYEEAKEEVKQAANGHGQAQDTFNRADASFQIKDDKVKSIREELAETGEDGSRRSLIEAELSKDEAKKNLDETQETERQTNNDMIRAEKDVEIQRNRTTNARTKRQDDIRDLCPHWRNWLKLKLRASREGLACRLLDEMVIQTYEQKGPPRAFEEASKHQGELKRILQSVPQGEDLWKAVEQLAEAQSGEERRGVQTLDAWLMIRRFLEQSIPRDIAQADDPEVALKQIENHLQRLNSRLIDQEIQLRQRTDTIANGILTRIRREERQIQRLSKGLEAVSFGSIASIRIRLERVEAMQRLLQSLKVQKDLFSSCISLEEAMAELYRQVGGGQVQGDQLLDYREYVRMSVEVQRLGSEKWTKASPSCLSTGESIGVGAAVLMVILDAWEHQAVLLRGKMEGGSLRFLFLDEAARLSPRSLDTLSELCERMDLQLLVAAPAADRARRGTAYRLVRHLGENGDEEVVVRGRRFTGHMAEG